MSLKNEYGHPLVGRALDRLGSSRDRLEAQARRYRALAGSAHPDFKKQYLDLAESIDAYLQRFPSNVEESA